MYQKGDFKAARRYYEAAIENMKDNMPVTDTIQSKEMQALANKLAQHKFLLACRQFQLGMACLETIKEAHPTTNLLQGKTSKGVIRQSVRDDEEMSRMISRVLKRQVNYWAYEEVKEEI